MIDLHAIVETLSTEEQQKFISYLEKKNKRSDTKNILLFKLLVKNEHDTSAICESLYQSQKKAAYHALRKRLFQSLIDFIANASLEEENSVDMQIIKYILAARTFLLHNKPKVAYKILDKAQLLAQEHFLFPMLNEIYHTKIQYAHSNPSINISQLITEFKANQKNYILEEELNIVYAKIREILNNINNKAEIVDFETILNNTLKAHNISITDSMSFKSLYQLMTIISISAFVTNDYLKTEPFLIRTYSIIKQHKDRYKQLYYHIQVLYIIANTLFRNKKFKESQYYLQLMHNYMLQNKKKHYNTFLPKYNFIRALNANFTNEQELAITILEPFKSSKHNDTEALLDINLSLVMFYIQKNDLKKAKELFSKFYHSDTWYIEKAGQEWTIKKNLIEIILYIELQDVNLTESRLLSFKRSYYPYLKQINQQRVITYLGFVEQYYKNPEQVSTQKFKDKIENAFHWIHPKLEDIFVMSFYAWLKSKMENISLCEATSQLIKKSQ
ncbi:hypothetical protein [Lacinutrix undariae]